MVHVRRKLRFAREVSQYLHAEAGIASRWADERYTGGFPWHRSRASSQPASPFLVDTYCINPKHNQLCPAAKLMEYIRQVSPDRRLVSIDKDAYAIAAVPPYIRHCIVVGWVVWSHYWNGALHRITAGARMQDQQPNLAFLQRLIDLFIPSERKLVDSISGGSYGPINGLPNPESTFDFSVRLICNGRQLP